MRRFGRAVRRGKYRQRGVTKAVSFFGKSKGRFPRCSASQFQLQKQKLKTP